MHDKSTLGPGVDCYTMAHIELGEYSVVSQRVFLCTGTHDIHRPAFQIYSKPIKIGAHAWICAEAFVGPGVTVGEGAVLAARAVTFKDMEPWSVYLGNPAQLSSMRTRFSRGD
jgi:putative colanic acid biosynthesis acetyltransferase WcaF